jgi:signal transduction histidine kinase
MTEPSHDRECWEAAYANQSFDAAVGRLCRGLLHNLNGVIQAFSMQGDLLELMFPKAEALLAEMESRVAPEAVGARIAALRDLLRSRAELVGPAQEKVREGQEILRRVSSLAAFSTALKQGRFTLNDLVRANVDFLAASPFFKHKVEKELRLAPDLPPLAGGQAEIFQVLTILLENALEAMQESDGPARLIIDTALDSDGYLLAVEHAGAGLAATDCALVFTPFFTTRADHAGLGLYLARKLITAMGGSISCESRPGLTRFSCRFPVPAGAAEGAG